MSDLIHRAKEFAAHAHHGQVRRYTAEPYIVHCGRVASIVSSSESDEAIAAAWLHDTVEDCGVTWKELSRAFGDYVTRKVWYLTDVPREIGNRYIRKNIDRDRLSLAPANVQTIKCADLIDNTSSIVTHDPKFAKLYLKEKRALLEVLTGANWHTRGMAFDVLNRGEAQLRSLQDAE